MINSEGKWVLQVYSTSAKPTFTPGDIDGGNIDGSDDEIIAPPSDGGDVDDNDSWGEI